ncbi:DUF6452 family protein [Psychroflexus sediminis]|uniref:SbsA Ig-like domain-containing protein n=1 Tax=Psychroflexus sediminis TaxID=470826 RepID=A0A1G7WV39_9FLAO|nr:DUF6452 family protein [Psychroflexus sediminis]SDG75801.1 hypothetical protein SAMN04488027_106150 [Psychroflexus sediminis]
MKKTLFTSLVILFILSIFTSCERDDICAESTETTPKLVIDFFDVNNPSNPRNVRNLAVREIENDTAILFNSTSSIAVPLKTDANETTYVFNLNALSESGGLTDTLTFSYDTRELYVNRACGFKVNFIDFRVEIQNKETNPENWIRDIQVRENSIENEFETHLYIFY